MTFKRQFILTLIGMGGLFGGMAFAEDLGSMPGADADVGVEVDGSVDVDGGAEMDSDASTDVSDRDAMLPPNNAPANWTCDPQWYEDGICDCGCTVPDRDCPRGLFNICERSGCEEGQVPWEHRPYSCMRSACGDGWLDELLGEVCDDGEALNSGGCSADCGAVNPGWVCGVKADGCESDGTKPEDMSMPEVDAFVPEDLSMTREMEILDMEVSESPPDTDVVPTFPDSVSVGDDGGCSTGGSGAGTGLLLLAWLALRRPRVQR